MSFFPSGMWPAESLHKDPLCKKHQTRGLTIQVLSEPAAARSLSSMRRIFSTMRAIWLLMPWNEPALEADFDSPRRNGKTMGLGSFRNNEDNKVSSRIWSSCPSRVSLWPNSRESVPVWRRAYTLSGFSYDRSSRGYAVTSSMTQDSSL